MRQLEQWVYRNATVLLQVKEGRTAAAHETILETMEGFLHTDPEQLPEEHCHLIFSEFAALASSPIKDKLEWISEIDLPWVPHHMWHGGLDMRYGPILLRPLAMCTD
jgi:hypothetical protein